MSNEEQLAFNLLKSISTSLKKISESLDEMKVCRKKETEQYLKESKQRMQKNSRILNENKIKEQKKINNIV